MFSEYYSSLSIYATSLKKIYDIECVSQNESLQIGISSFKSDILNQCKSLNEFLSSIKEDIIIPLCLLRENILSKIRKNLDETSKIEKAYRSCVLGIETVKKNFYSSVKEIENYKIKYEIKELPSYNRYNQDYIPSSTLNFELGVNQPLAFAQESDKIKNEKICKVISITCCISSYG